MTCYGRPDIVVGWSSRNSFCAKITWLGGSASESRPRPKVGLNSVPRAAVVIEPVSANSLRKTGIFREWAGDFPAFRSGDWKSGRVETKSNAGKARIPGL